MPSTPVCLIATTVLATLPAESGWVFNWPYGEDGSCHCEERAFGMESYLTEESCLEAYVESEYEYCSYKGRALVEKQCDFAVSVTEGLHNTHCAGKCSQVVAGLLSVADYMKECDLEVVADFGYAVATLANSCYSNNVFGWADYNPSGVQKAPLRFFENVGTAARCQELCQDVPECATFVWRAVPDHESTVSFQNEPHTCILYDVEFMNHVVSDPIPSSFGNPTEYCDVPSVGECASISFPRARYNLLEDQTCLYCGCEPRCIFYSPSHVTGPAFCRHGLSELCDFTRPVWTTTTPEPECPTETCVVPGTTTAAAVNTEEGTSVTDFVLTSTVPVRTTTTASVDDQTTDSELTQMTAQSDTALTSTAPIASSQETVSIVGTTQTTQIQTEATETTVLLETTPGTTPETTTNIALETTTPNENVESSTPTATLNTDMGASTTVPVLVDTTQTKKFTENTDSTTPGFYTSSPVEGASTTTPVEGASTTSPAEAASTIKPAEDSSTTRPVEGDSTTSPAEGASTTAPVEGASTTAPVEGASTTVPAEGASTTVPAEGASTTAPVEGASTTPPAEGASTSAAVEGGSTTPPAEGASTTTPPVAASTTKSVPEGCVPDCPDCPCFVESDCDDCYSISDCMDDEC